MRSDYGKQTILQGGREIRTIAKGDADWKAGGVTIDWSTVATNAGGTTLPDGTVVPAGTKFLRYGQVLSRITASGKFGPADSGAADGRQTMTIDKRGEAFVLDRTITEAEYGSNQVGDVFDGGTVFESRIIMASGVAPTRTQFVTMFPDITFIKD